MIEQYMAFIIFGEQIRHSGREANAVLSFMSWLFRGQSDNADVTFLFYSLDRQIWII